MHAGFEEPRGAELAVELRCKHGELVWLHVVVAVGVGVSFAMARTRIPGHWVQFEMVPAILLPPQTTWCKDMGILISAWGLHELEHVNFGWALILILPSYFGHLWTRLLCMDGSMYPMHKGSLWSLGCIGEFGTADMGSVLHCMTSKCMITQSVVASGLDLSWTMCWRSRLSEYSIPASKENKD